jgi:2,3-bisphosphoglycerate-independent phosphoglycerate mutase
MTTANTTPTKKPAVLIVRDGWGRNPNSEHDAFNAVKLANTPIGDALLQKYPWTLIETSGEDVGLPDETMGNSEVGHQNIGAGRIVNQESVRITKAIRTGEFFENEALVSAINTAKQNNKTVHLLGIASDAGVHGRLGHLFACIELCKKLGQEKVAIHLFTDGRDTGPFTGKAYIETIQAKCDELGTGQIASIIGRYYAMDRDNRWERVQKAYRLMVEGNYHGEVGNYETAAAAMQDYYDNPFNDSQQGDEFVLPRTIAPSGDPSSTRISSGDTVIFYNYRGDRPREITKAFVKPDFLGHMPPSPDSGEKGFDRAEQLELNYVTMTAYEEMLNQWVAVAYPKQGKMVNTLGQYLSDLGLTQFRTAETEKFPHVTFFFNDYREEPYPGEGRQMAQSPSVATYDLQPEMSANEICDIVLSRLAADDCEDVIIVNFANGDMVGHTGKLDAAIKAVETVDSCVGKIVDATLAKGGALVVTADHGNAEQMFDPQTGAPHTAHTTYSVECIIVDDSKTQLADGDAVEPAAALKADGRLADVVPTMLALMGLDQPAEMTGGSLIK